MSTNPTIVVGDVLSNIPLDTLRVAYTKYNTHYHNEATIADFSYYPLVIGDEINLYNNGELVLEESRILRINQNRLELEDNSINDFVIENGTLTVPAKNITIPYINIPIRTNTVELISGDGFINRDTLKRFKTKVFPIVLNNYTLNQRMVLIPPELYSIFRIKRIIINAVASGLTDVIINKVNSSLVPIENENINIISNKGLLIVEEYTLGDNFTYTNEGLAITVLGTSNPSFTINLELITP